MRLCCGSRGPPATTYKRRMGGGETGRVGKCRRGENEMYVKTSDFGWRVGGNGGCGRFE